MTSCHPDAPASVCAPARAPRRVHPGIHRRRCRSGSHVAVLDASGPHHQGGRLRPPPAAPAPSRPGRRRAGRAAASPRSPRPAGSGSARRRGAPNGCASAPRPITAIQPTTPRGATTRTSSQPSSIFASGSSRTPPVSSPQLPTITLRSRRRTGSSSSSCSTHPRLPPPQLAGPGHDVGPPAHPLLEPVLRRSP